MASLAKPAGPVPDAASLHEAALRHLSRFAVTEAGLVRVLDRRVQRWARQATVEGREVGSAIADAQAAARQVARSLVELGLINDAQFASARALRLTRSGRSRKAVAAHLAQKGVGPETAQGALPGAEREFAAALAYARRRHLGPFRVLANAEADDPVLRQRDLGAFARAGFSREIAQRALQTSLPAAEEFVIALKRG